MMKCIALENSLESIDIVQTYCAKIDFLKLTNTFTNTNDVIRFLSTAEVDLLFIRIEMSEITGIDFYKSLTKPFNVIFISDKTTFAAEAFDLNAIDYLISPFSFGRFLQAVEKAQMHYQCQKMQLASNIRHITVRSEYNHIKIPFEEILYIETLDDYIKIHSTGRKPTLTLMTMKSVLEKLPASEFIRVHRSFIIPLNRIVLVNTKYIDLGIIQIPIGTKYEKDFFRVYTSESFF